MILLLTDKSDNNEKIMRLLTHYSTFIIISKYIDHNEFRVQMNMENTHLQFVSRGLFGLIVP
jgi:hypothetical protein